MMDLVASEGVRLLDLLDRIRSNNGLPMLALIAFVCFLCYVFSHFSWKTWRATAQAKDEEIARLTKELERYQSIVFDRLLDMDDMVVVTHRGWPEDEGGSGSSSQEQVH
jgi:hypothetical protein